MLINFTNHPSRLWCESQRIATFEEFGAVTDVPFPAVDAAASEAEITALARDIVSYLIALKPTAVLCQGEFSLAFAVASGLMQHSVHVFCATSERRSLEHKLEDGSTEKQSVFEFVKFREYSFLSNKEDPIT